MTKIYIIILLMILLTSQKIYSQSDKWTFMFDWGGENNNDFSSYYDLDGLTYGDCFIEVWIKTIYNHNWETEVIEGSGIKKKVSYSLNKNRYYCGEQRIVTFKDIVYFDTGESRTFTPGFSTDKTFYFDKIVKEIIPGTNMETQYLFFCFK